MISFLREKSVSSEFLMDELNFYRAIPPSPVTVQANHLLIHVATELILLQLWIGSAGPVLDY